MSGFQRVSCRLNAQCIRRDVLHLTAWTSLLIHTWLSPSADRRLLRGGTFLVHISQEEPCADLVRVLVLLWSLQQQLCSSTADRLVFTDLCDFTGVSDWWRFLFILWISEQVAIQWMSEQILNGTSAQLGYTVPFTLENTRQKTNQKQTQQKLNTIQKKQTTQNTAEQN